MSQSQLLLHSHISQLQMHGFNQFWIKDPEHEPGVLTGVVKDFKTCFKGGGEKKRIEGAV